MKISGPSCPTAGIPPPPDAFIPPRLAGAVPNLRVPQDGYRIPEPELRNPARLDIKYRLSLYNPRSLECEQLSLVMGTEITWCMG